MTQFASLIFLLLTPHTSQSVKRASDCAYAAGRTNRDLVMFVETVKIDEMIRLRKIERERHKIDDAEFMQVLYESKRMSDEATRERERARRAAYAKQNPGG